MSSALIISKSGAGVPLALKLASEGCITKLYVKDSSDQLLKGYTQPSRLSTIDSNFGDLNGTWGTYASASAQANCSNTECSGTSGDHSNGTGDGSLAY